MRGGNIIRFYSKYHALSSGEEVMKIGWLVTETANHNSAIGRHLEFGGKGIARKSDRRDR